MTPQGFQRALQRLVNDAGFRQRVESNPSVLEEFSFDTGALGAEAGRLQVRRHRRRR
jgi:hypothetical protein